MKKKNVTKKDEWTKQRQAMDDWINSYFDKYLPPNWREIGKKKSKS